MWDCVYEFGEDHHQCVAGSIDHGPRGSVFKFNAGLHDPGGHDRVQLGGITGRNDYLGWEFDQQQCNGTLAYIREPERIGGVYE